MNTITTALRRLKLGIYIVTASAGEGTKRVSNGLTAAWVTQVSQRPPMVVVSIAPARYTLELIRKAGSFGLNVMAQGERGVELGRLFGLVSGRKMDKLAQVKWESGAKLGVPLLKEASTWMECRMVDEFPAGDHFLMVGEVVAATIRGEEETLTYRFNDYW